VQCQPANIYSIYRKDGLRIWELAKIHVPAPLQTLHVALGKLFRARSETVRYDSFWESSFLDYSSFSFLAVRIL